MAIDVFKEYLEEYAGNIMILTGVVLLVTGVMFISTFGSLLSVFTIFFGIVFAAYGFFARLGFFYLKLRSLNGVGTILLCLSVVFLALSVSLLMFLAVKGITTLPQFVRGVLRGYVTIVSVYRPYAWLSVASILTSTALFIAGVIVKVYCSLR